MTRRPDQRRSRSPVTWILLSLVASLLLGVLSFVVATTSDAQDCPAGQVLSSNGVTCEPETTSLCPPGQQLDEAGLLCVDIEQTTGTVCPPGEKLDEAGLLCVPDIPPTGSACPPGEKLDEAGLLCIDDGSAADDDTGVVCGTGFSLAADGATCIADGPDCDPGEILDDDGDCVRTFQCSPGLILASDLLSCISGGCPDDELLSVDGKRCLAPDSDCPDGSPRPVGGACLVVEAVENEDGSSEVIVRCDADDLFCQALINECAEERASGTTEAEDGECADPRTSCDDDDDDCEAANERLVECATLDRTEDDDPDAEVSQSLDACDDLCPRLHRLDASGACVEFLDPTHPCVSFGKVPRGVTTNVELDRYSYLAGTGQCVTRVEFLRRLANFEAAAGLELDALTLLRETTSSYLTVEERLDELALLLIQREEDVVNFTQAAADADLERARAEKLLFETGKQLGRETDRLKAEVLEFFVAGGNDVAVAQAVLIASNLTDIAVTRVYGRALLADQVAILDRIEKLQTDTAELTETLIGAQAEVDASLAAAVESRETLELLLSEAETIRAEQLARRDEEAALVAALREDKADFARELGVFDQASREIADIISESEFLVTEFADFDGKFADPVIPADIGSGYGPRLHPILGYVRNHDGVDFHADFGQPIYASAPGVVQIASTFGGYGRTVVLDHGEGLLTLYAHMSVIGVESGDQVERGDILGFVGSTGLSTGPHLHFEVWVEGKTAVDPVGYLLQDDS